MNRPPKAGAPDTAAESPNARLSNGRLNAEMMDCSLIAKSQGFQAPPENRVHAARGSGRQPGPAAGDWFAADPEHSKYRRTFENVLSSVEQMMLNFRLYALSVYALSEKPDTNRLLSVVRGSPLPFPANSVRSVDLECATPCGSVPAAAARRPPTRAARSTPAPSRSGQGTSPPSRAPRCGWPPPPQRIVAAASCTTGRQTMKPKPH